MAFGSVEGSGAPLLDGERGSTAQTQGELSALAACPSLGEGRGEASVAPKDG